MLELQSSLKVSATILQPSTSFVSKGESVVYSEISCASYERAIGRRIRCIATISLNDERPRLHTHNRKLPLKSRLRPRFVTNAPRGNETLRPLSEKIDECNQSDIVDWRLGLGPALDYLNRGNPRIRSRHSLVEES
jgi:hypothetical protein